MGLNKPVDFTTAKLLKEKGFEQLMQVGTICRIQNKANKHYEKTRPIRESDLENEWSIFNETYPTIVDVVMWCFKKHGIWISVVQNEYLDKFQYTLTQKKSNSWNIVDNDKLFNSPTEAYEAAIKHCLEKII